MVSGKVFLHGELWNAISDEEIKAGEEVVVTGVEGLILNVKKRQGG
jgi:membrane-bound serine protease (ClpP class)